tara:strand:+ start:345 stop:446 length:102 start_codon:yes stop_codon:yes gene_type:complete
MVAAVVPVAVLAAQREAAAEVVVLAVSQDLVEA